MGLVCQVIYYLKESLEKEINAISKEIHTFRDGSEGLDRYAPLEVAEEDGKGSRKAQVTRCQQPD